MCSRVHGDTEQLAWMVAVGRSGLKINPVEKGEKDTVFRMRFVWYWALVRLGLFGDACCCCWLDPR